LRLKRESFVFVNTTNGPYNFGLVLSGGGTRGAFHIGLIKYLQETGIRPDILAGCSAGALVGALYAAGNEADSIYTFMEKTSLFSHPSFTINHPGFFDSPRYMNDLRPYFRKDDFDSLDFELRIYSTDLVRGELVEHRSGTLVDCIMASCAIPGIFTPVKKDGMLLSDGGIVKVFPVSPIRTETKRILGVLITNQGIKPANEFKNTHHVLDRALILSIYTRAKEESKLCDWLIDPPEIARFNMISKKHFREMYELGYDYARQVIPGVIRELDTI
jgi:NTE family protein